MKNLTGEASEEKNKIRLHLKETRKSLHMGSTRPFGRRLDYFCWPSMPAIKNCTRKGTRHNPGGSSYLLAFRFSHFIGP